MKKNNIAVIGLGSNIHPEENIASAKKEIGKLCKIVNESDFVYTKPLLYSEQADFLNGALLTLTNLDVDTLRKELKKLEVRLGRIKSKNKNGPRTIDLDVLIYNDIVTDNDIYQRDFLKNSITELLPDFSFEQEKVLWKTFQYIMKQFCKNPEFLHNHQKIPKKSHIFLIPYLVPLFAPTVF